MYLALDPHDALIATLAIDETARLYLEREKQIADYLATSTAGQTTRGITTWIARAFRGS